MNLMVSRDKPTRLFSFCVKATVHIVAVSGGIAGHYSILPERNGVSAGCGLEDSHQRHMACVRSPHTQRALPFYGPTKWPHGRTRHQRPVPQ